MVPVQRKATIKQEVLASKPMNYGQKQENVQASHTITNLVIEVLPTTMPLDTNVSSGNNGQFPSPKETDKPRAIINPICSSTPATGKQIGYRRQSAPRKIVEHNGFDTDSDLSSIPSNKTIENSKGKINKKGKKAAAKDVGEDDEENMPGCSEEEPWNGPVGIFENWSATLTNDSDINMAVLQEKKRFEDYMDAIMLEFPETYQLKYNSQKARDVSRAHFYFMMWEEKMKLLKKNVRDDNNFKSLLSRYKLKMIRNSEAVSVLYLRQRIEEFKLRLKTLSNVESSLRTTGKLPSSLDTPPPSDEELSNDGDMHDKQEISEDDVILHTVIDMDQEAEPTTTTEEIIKPIWMPEGEFESKLHEFASFVVANYKPMKVD